MRVSVFDARFTEIEFSPADSRLKPRITVDDSSHRAGLCCLSAICNVICNVGSLFSRFRLSFGFRGLFGITLEIIKGRIFVTRSRKFSEICN